jgi:dUTP pyrophosphatase
MNYQLDCWSAGMDIRASITESIIQKPLRRAIVKTGFVIWVTSRTEAQVRPATQPAKGITGLNAPGTIITDYRGRDRGCIPVNLSNEDFTINGDTSHNWSLQKPEQPTWEE